MTSYYARYRWQSYSSSCEYCAQINKLRTEGKEGKKERKKRKKEEKRKKEREEERKKEKKKERKRNKEKKEKEIQKESFSAKRNLAHKLIRLIIQMYIRN
jgi:hypothetical protein